MSKSLGRSLQRVKGPTPQLHALLQPRMTETKALRPSDVARTGGGNVCVRPLEESCTVNIWTKVPAAALNSVDVRKVRGA